jgi:hypothetical protein
MNRSFPWQPCPFRALKRCTAHEFAAELGGVALESATEDLQSPIVGTRGLLSLARVITQQRKWKIGQRQQKVWLVRIHSSELRPESDLKEGARRASPDSKSGTASRRWQ